MKLAAAPILGAIWLYRGLISAPLHALYGPAMGCRFYPTCSHYATEAVEVHGPIFGLWLATKRVLKCTPFHSGGMDPVPLRHAKGSLRCERVASALNSASAPLSTSASSASSQLLFHG